MKTNLSKIIVSLLSFLFLSLEVAGREKEINLKVIDFQYEEGKATIFHLKKENTELLNPEHDFDKYILVRAGIRNPSIRPKRFDTFSIPISSIKEDVCTLENNFDENFIIGSNNKTVKEKFKTFRQCLRFKIEDPKKGGIEFEPSQINCSIERINNDAIILSGGDCFLKAKEKQILTFEIYPDPKCHDREFLAQNGISPSEILADLQTYIYPKKELGPVFVPTRKLWESRLSINFNPGTDLLSTAVNEDYERNVTFQRIDNFIFPDISISSLNFNVIKKYVTLNLGFIISTFGGSNSCKSGICSNYLNYDIPFAPFLIFYEWDSQRGKKYELASSGRIGDRFPGQWNGEFEALDYLDGISIEKGKKYSIELIFSDPNDDYARLKKQHSSLLNNGRLAFGSYRPGADEFSPFGGFSGFEDFEGLPNLNENIFETISGIPEDFIPRIVESLKDFTFPPSYSKVCNKNLAVCKKISKKEFLKFLITFEVQNIQGTQVILGNDILVERISDFFPKLTTKLDMKNKPRINCK